MFIEWEQIAVVMGEAGFDDAYQFSGTTESLDFDTSECLLLIAGLLYAVTTLPNVTNPDEWEHADRDFADPSLMMDRCVW